MTLSIIIPSYNKKESLMSLLALLNKQSADFSDFEVIVVDDGSSVFMGNNIQCRKRTF
ncbi:glycosyltransferase [Xenorhabdus sp. SGI246]|uniref:glycosyltransferase n=1 Tax=Xenorhabdus sp. SGI246 TaxID=3158263 RepID=UPI00349F2A08